VKKERNYNVYELTCGFKVTYVVSNLHVNS